MGSERWEEVVVGICRVGYEVKGASLTNISSSQTSLLV